MFKKIKKFFSKKKPDPIEEIRTEKEAISVSEKSTVSPSSQYSVSNSRRTVLVFDTQKRIFVVKKRVARIALYHPESQTMSFKSLKGIETTLTIPLEKGHQAQPLSGFWFDKETCHIGLYVPSLEQFYLFKDQQLQNIKIDAQQFVGVGDYQNMVPVSGFLFDIDLETIGLYDPSSALFLLKHSDAKKDNSTIFQYGPFKNTMQVLIGDWTGSGLDSTGLYDAQSGVFFLKENLHVDTSEDINFHFGPCDSHMQALVGDWDASGYDKVALYLAEDGLFFLKTNNQVNDNSETHCYFGPQGKHIQAFVGDWTGIGHDGVGVYDKQSGTVYLKNDCISGNADIIIQFSKFEENSVPVVVYDLA